MVHRVALLCSFLLLLEGCDATQQKSDTDRQGTRIRADQFYALRHECEDAYRAKAYALAESKCNQALEAAAALPERDSMQKDVVLQMLGHTYFAQRRFEKALAVYNQELQEVVKYEGPDSAGAATANRNIGRALCASGQAQSSEPYYKKSVAGWDLELSKAREPGLRVALKKKLRQVLSEYADVLDSQGKFDEAREIREKASGYSN